MDHLIFYESELMVFLDCGDLKIKMSKVVQHLSFCMKLTLRAPRFLLRFCKKTHTSWLGMIYYIYFPDVLLNSIWVRQKKHIIVRTFISVETYFIRRKYVVSKIHDICVFYPQSSNSETPTPDHLSPRWRPKWFAQPETRDLARKREAIADKLRPPRGLISINRFA